ncbi:MAG TPA: hypothetical protein QGH28_01545 [Chloroflexota bacterium]|nr:hypothetical protein [Chloroflexota bacterium]
MRTRARIVIADRRGLLLPLVLLAVLALAGRPAAANGAHPDAWTYYSDPAGPYFVQVELAPYIGIVHVAVFASEIGSGAPVTDLAVTVSARPEGDGWIEWPAPVGPLTSRRVAAKEFGTDLVVEPAGLWAFTITLHGAPGAAVVDLQVPLTKQRSLGGLLPAIVLIALVALVVPVFLLRRYYRGLREPPARPDIFEE